MSDLIAAFEHYREHGDFESYEQVCELAWPQLGPPLRRYSNDQDLIDESCIDTLLKLPSVSQAVENPEKVLSFLSTIAKRTIWQKIRRRKKF